MFAKVGRQRSEVSSKVGRQTPGGAQGEFSENRVDVISRICILCLVLSSLLLHFDSMLRVHGRDA